MLAFTKFKPTLTIASSLFSTTNLASFNLENHLKGTPECNITPQVWKLVHRNLLNIPNHPLSILKTKI